MVLLLYLLIGIIVFFAVLFVAYKIAAYKYNQRPKPDLYYDVYTKQDTTPEGKVAVFLVGLSMTADFEPGWWSNIFEHVRHNIIPWPGSFFAGLDQGLALLDPDRFYEYEEFVPNWLKLSPPFVDPLVEEVKKLVATYDFSKTEVVLSQDHFADPIWDPKEKYLSTNRAYLEGERDGFDYVVQQPMEFYTENTDTMFSHAHHNYHHFEGYNVYETIDYPDWDVPYTRELDLKGTRTIYNGVLVGKYRRYVADAFTQSMDSILSKSPFMQKQLAEQTRKNAAEGDTQILSVTSEA